MKPLTDAEMFATAPVRKPLTDEEMFGAGQNIPLKTDLSQSGSDQKAGPVVSPSGLLNAITPTKEQLPELIGTTVGGMAGGIPGAMLGAAAGDAYKQLGQHAGILKGTAPETSGEAAKGILGGAVRGGVAEVGGKLLGKAFSPFAESFTPEAAAAKTAAESVGIEVPLGNLTESKPVQVAERALEYTPFGQAITNQRKAALEGLKSYTDSIAGKIATGRPPEVTGNLAKQALAELPAKYGETTDKLYDSVIPLIEKANPEPVLDKTISTMNDILNRRRGEMAPAGLGEIKESFDNIVGKLVPSKILNKSGQPYSQKLSSTIKIFEELKRFRTNLGLKTSFNNAASSGLESDYKELYGAVTEDLNDTVKRVSSGAYNDLKEAGAKYAEGKQLIGNSLFRAISSAKPENVYKLVIVPGSPSQAELGKELLGDNFKDVARQWFGDVVAKSTGPDGAIRPAVLSKWLKSYETVIPQITADNPALANEFDKLRQISNVLSNRGNQAVGGSQTAYAGTTIGAIASTIFNLFSGNYKAAAIGAGMVGASGLGVAAMKSQAGRELLTAGYPTVGKVAGRGAQVGIGNLIEKMASPSYRSVPDKDFAKINGKIRVKIGE